MIKDTERKKIEKMIKKKMKSPKSQESEEDRKSEQHSVSSEYQYVSTESLNNLCAKIGSLIGEMKELN